MQLSAALALSAFLFFGQSGEKAHLSELQVSIEARRVEVSFRLVNGFTDEVLERIQTGLATGFTYQFRLFRDQKRWWDNKLDSSNLQVIAQYNAVTREYLVNFRQDGKLIDSRVARDRDELEQAMTRFESLPVLELGDLKPNKRFLIRARAELGSRTMMLIIPTRVHTDWVRSKKFFPPPDAP